MKHNPFVCPCVNCYICNPDLRAQQQREDKMRENPVNLTVVLFSVDVKPPVNYREE